jgi:hypothetical protein
MAEGGHQRPNVVREYAFLGAICGVVAAVLSVAAVYGRSGSFSDEKTGLLLPILYTLFLSSFLGLLLMFVGAIVGRFVQSRAAKG